MLSVVVRRNAVVVDRSASRRLVALLWLVGTGVGLELPRSCSCSYRRLAFSLPRSTNTEHGKNDDEDGVTKEIMTYDSVSES